MQIDKNKLIQDIEAIKAKLALMEEELNKLEASKHFPSKGDEYYYYTSKGTLDSNIAYADGLRVNVYKSKKEAHKAYKKAVALEKIKRRLPELQGDWKPNWKDSDEGKIHIIYDHFVDGFVPEAAYTSQRSRDFPYMKSIEIAKTIIEEMEDELKLIFDIA